MADFVHIHNHSQYSKFDGFSSIKGMVAKAKEMNMPALGLTDHGTIAGVITFLKECRAQGIKPILGVEAYLCRDHRCHSKDGQPDGRRGNRHINVIAKNFKGYQNLCALAQKSSLEGYYYDPRIDLELLAQHKDGLVVTSACLSNIVNWHLVCDRYKEAKEAAGIFQDIFGGDYYLEMMFHGIDSEAKILPSIQRLSSELGIKTIIANDSHYINKDDAEFHEYLMCLSSKRSIRDPKRLKFPFDEFYLKSEEEMLKLFRHCRQSMYNTLEIADKCDYSEIVFGSMRLPVFELPEGFTDPLVYLRKLAWEGLKKERLNQSKPHVDRLTKEIDDVTLIRDTKQFDFATYFLIVEDMMRFARDRKIASGVRGSGYGSLLLKCLGITEGVDPLEQDLLWERFISSERISFPDVDMDFDYARRHEIIEYLQQKYGDDRVGSIGTVLTLKTKAAVRKTVEVLDPENSIDYSDSKPDRSRNYALQNEILNTLPKSQSAFRKRDGSPIKCIDDACETFSDFARYMKQYPEVHRVAKKLEGSVSAYGCLAKDTLIKTDQGWVRIDQIDDACKVLHIDKSGKEQYTSDFHPHCTGVKKCYKMRLSNGTWIKVTDEHLIFTDQGCVEFEKIRKNPEKYKVCSVKRIRVSSSVKYY